MDSKPRKPANAPARRQGAPQRKTVAPQRKTTASRPQSAASQHRPATSQRQSAAPRPTVPRRQALARQQVLRRRRQLIAIGVLGTAVIVMLTLMLLPKGGTPDRATLAAVPSAPTQAAADPLAAEPTPQPTPTPAPTPEPLTARAATRPTPTAPGYGLVFSRSETDEKIIAITVDDCYQADNLKQIVDKAIEVGGKLTLFPIGENVLKEKQSQILKYAWEQGFELENHTFTHHGLYNIPDDKMAEEVYKQQLALSYILNVEYQCHFLRPKGGDARRDQRMQKYAEQLGYYGIAHWTYAGSTGTIEGIKEALKPGTIYLFHTTTNEDLGKLLEFMPYAVSQGYQLVTLNEMFGYPPNETAPLTVPIQDHTIPTPEPFERVYDVYKPTRYSWGAYLLQEKLIELGYMKGEPDGVYGKGCAKCVKAYQKDHGLKATGVADVETQEHIFGVPSGGQKG